jgi:hypothetical protein
VKNVKFIKISMWAGLVFLILKLISYFKISFVFGSHSLYFAGAAILFPIIGSILRIPLASIVAGFGMYSVATGSLYGVTFGLPTLVATLCWRLYFSKKNNLKNILSFVLEVFVPLFCMAFFVFHPIAKGAWFYSLYWLFPPVLYFINSKSTFSYAMRSTFVAHAIGSVLWCYAIPMTSVQWISLIPFVAVERFVFAGSQTFLICLKNRILGYTFLGRNVFTSTLKKESDAAPCSNNEWQSSVGARK